MTYLAILDQSPIVSAQYLADVHLAPTATAIAKLISTAVMQHRPDHVRTVTNNNGILEYRFGNVVLLPPVRDPALQPWVDWIKEEYQRGWWLLTYSWWLDKELDARFGRPNHPDAVRFNLWQQQEKILNVFEKNGKPASEFPVVIPTSINPLIHTPINQYRDYYKGLQQRVRMKWSGPRSKPEWMGGPKQPKQQELGLARNKGVCDVCGSDAGGDKCDFSACPMVSHQ